MEGENDEWEGDWENSMDVDYTSLQMKNSLSTTTESVKVLDPEKDLKPALEKNIQSLMELYSVSQDAMIIIARHYRWNSDKINDVWFAEQDKLQYSLGLTPNPAMSKDKLISSSLLSNNP